MHTITQTSYQGIDALTLTSRPIPRLNPLAVRIETRYTPVMPYDILTETGQLKTLRPVKLPIVVGYGFGGIVREVGGLRNSQLLNRPVIGIQPTGSHQEQILSTLPPLLFPVPQNVSLADATTLIGGADAAYFVFKKSQLRAGETALVTGASGSVGTYFLQLAQLFGVHTIAIGHSSRHKLLQTLGAEQVLDYDLPLDQQLAEAPAVSQVIDLAGSTALLDQLTAALGPVKILSFAQQQYRTRPQQSFSFVSGAITPSDYRWLLTQLAQHKLRAVIHEQFPFIAVKTAQHHLLSEHAAGRILLTYNQEA
ncbi:NADP-dependent oxidoreductase [Levilactobacillus parabrevis]|uniref:quinone oxidoreductase family protein n=1 Tax=Levilactobacillus parabrevis TaxID=357278 RepID=UPI0021A90554|nr:zinc-binding dehydrogenase [Levilactobacillus parabrevis]MCT4489122.1 NADP-dependent oxidoreductase [Levilactobacillus parabrevis]